MKTFTCAALALAVLTTVTGAQDDVGGAPADARTAPEAAAEAPLGEEIARPTFGDFMRRLVVGPGLTLSVVQMNDFTTENIFEPPTVYSMRAQARQSAMFFLQGTAASGAEFDPSRFRLEQGTTSLGMPTVVNISNFEKKRVSTNERVNGVIQFKTALDYGKPFSVIYGTSRVEFAFDELRMLVAMPPVVTAQ